MTILRDYSSLSGDLRSCNRPSPAARFRFACCLTCGEESASRAPTHPHGRWLSGSLLGAVFLYFISIA